MFRLQKINHCMLSGNSDFINKAAQVYIITGILDPPKSHKTHKLDCDGNLAPIPRSILINETFVAITKVRNA